jgi:Flp pilus assembly protein TadD
LAAVVLITAGTLAYLNSFSGPFVFDDEPSILGNASIRSFATAWRPPADGGLTVSGRPVLNLSLALNHAISGDQVWSYHALNLLIHLAGGLTLFGLVRRTLRQPVLAARYAADAQPIALLAAALWLLHPLQTAAVTYIIQRAESLCALFYLLTLYSFVRSVQPGAPRRWRALTFTACLLGMGTKEVMATAPLLVLLYDRTFAAGSFAGAWRARRGLHLSLAATWLALLALVLATEGRGDTAGFGTAVTPAAYALTQVKAIAHYLRLAVWPAPLVLDYGRSLVSSWTEVLVPALLLVPLVAASLWYGARGHAAGFCGLGFFLILAPSSSFVPVATQTIAEHRMYLPLAALTTLIAVVAWRWLGRRGLAVLATVAVGFGALTAQRNEDYATQIGLYEDTLAKVPDNARARALLAEYYVRAGRLGDARRELERSLADEPGVPEVLNNLGLVCQRLGDHTRAVECFQQVLVLRPREPEFANNLGNALVRAGRLTEGISQLEAAVRLAPELVDSRFNLASALAQGGRTEEAMAALTALLTRHPDDAGSHNLLGNLLLAASSRPEAIEHLTAAVRLAPANADYHNQLGIALGRAGRLREALVEFEAALKLDPAHPSAAKNAALARQRLGGY